MDSKHSLPYHIYPYSSQTNTVYLFTTPSTPVPSPLIDHPSPRDPSPYFTIARTLIVKSFNLFPICSSAEDDYLI